MGIRHAGRRGRMPVVSGESPCSAAGLPFGVLVAGVSVKEAEKANHGEKDEVPGLRSERVEHVLPMRHAAIVKALARGRIDPCTGFP